MKVASPKNVRPFFAQGLCYFFFVIGVSTASLRAENLVGYWKFDQEGGVFENLAGSGSPAKVEPEESRNETPLVEDKIGDLKHVIEFEGSGNFWIKAPLKLPTENFTIESWVRIEELPKEKSVIMGAESGLIVLIYPNGTLAFLAAAGDDGSKWFFVEIRQAMHPGEWVHLMVRMGNGVQQIFVQDGAGLHKSQDVVVENPKVYGGFATLGINGSDHSMPFRGKIAAFKIYDGNLSEEEFQNSNP